MKLYAVTSATDDGDYYIDFYMADDYDHAEDQCFDENPNNTIYRCVKVPFYIIERAYIIESKANKGGE